MEQYEVTRNGKIENQANEQDIEGRSRKSKQTIPHTTPCDDTACLSGKPHTPQDEQFTEVFMDIRNEIKSYIVREGVTMTEIVEKLADEYGWSESVPNFSGKLQRGSLRYTEAVQLADALGYDLVWVKRGKGGR